MASTRATVPPPSRLSKILTQLNAGHKPYLNNVKGLKLRYAFRNDHWGARHFVKNDLPRIRYINPRLEVEVAKVPKTKEEDWKPEMTVELRDGSSRKVDLDQKWSSTIFKELMEIGGGPAWAKWKEERAAAGLPVIDVPLPARKPLHTAQTSSPSTPDRTKTGAAAVLP